MKLIKVKAEHNYQVQIGINATEKIKEISALHNKVLLIAPRSLISKFKIKSKSNLRVFGIVDGENQKSLATLDRVWKECSIEGIKRSDAIIGLGGGATTDLAGFAAATWMRGVNWYAIPTSLAGMVDASVGGKTGINSIFGKNLIGAFHSPKQVFVDLNFLAKLPARDLSAGMAEVIKCGFISDYKILNLVQDDQIDFESVVYRSIKVKSEVVSKDFRESKLREILNYGHTLGHAIEKESRYKLRHGEAVSIGMVFAAELSALSGKLSNDEVDLHRSVFSKLGLPMTYRADRWEMLLSTIQRDKKTRSGVLRFVVLDQIGKPSILHAPTRELLFTAYQTIVE